MNRRFDVLPQLPVRLFLLVLLLPLVTPTSSVAQNTEDQNYFDFSLPGARSRGIGGAFVAVADDATAVYSNPAGLTQLFRPEVSIEVANGSSPRVPSMAVTVTVRLPATASTRLTRNCVSGPRLGASVVAWWRASRRWWPHDRARQPRHGLKGHATAGER